MSDLSVEQKRRAVYMAEQRIRAIERGELPARDRPLAERALKAARTRLQRTAA